MRSYVLWTCKNTLLWASVCSIVVELLHWQWSHCGIPSTWRISAYEEYWYPGLCEECQYRKHRSLKSLKGFFVVLVWFGGVFCVHVSTSGRCTYLQKKKSKFGDKRQLCVGPASQGNEQHKNGIWDYTGSIQAYACTNRPQFSDEAPGISYDQI